MSFIQTRAHGNGFVPQQPASGILLQVEGTAYTDVTGMPFGWGKTFRIATGRGTWFHIGLPSVTQLERSRLYLDQFYVFFTAEVLPGNTFTTQVPEVHAWDGSAQIFRFRPPQPYAGNWSGPREVTDDSGNTFGNTWYPRRRDNGQRFLINTAVGVSLRAGALQEGNITFHSAGANFEDTPE